ncbi:MAG: MIT C-terminal domain-containing protein [Bacteroidota bacterium]
MKRISSIIREYNIGVQTLIYFLLKKGYNGTLSLTTKISEPFLSLIDEEFKSELQIKEISRKIEKNKTAIEIQLDSLKSIPIGYTKRIKIDTGSNLTFQDLFGACFYGVKNIICIDPYLRKEYQYENLRLLIKMIKRFTSNSIQFQLLTCWDSKVNNSKEQIEKILEEIKTKFSNEFFDFIYSIEKPDLYHDRHIFIDNKYIIDLSRGLDIFQNFTDVQNVITKSCTIFITRLK